MKPERNALSKQRFLQGVRQKWAVVFLLWGFAILIVSMFYPHVTVSPFLSYGGMIGTSFILGLSVDSAIKTNAAAHVAKTPTHYEDAQ